MSEASETIAPWGFPSPSWVVNVDVEVDPGYQTMVTLQGQAFTAGAYTARIEKAYLIAHHDGDALFDGPVSVVTGDLKPTHTAEQALQIAEVIGAAGRELRALEAVPV